MGTRLMRGLFRVLVCCFVAASARAAVAEAPLLAHWKLAGDGRDASGSGRDLLAHGIDWSAGGDGTAAGFDGRRSFLELPAERAPRLGRGDFTLSLRVHTDEKLDDVLGDLACHYDPATRTGWQLSLLNLAGVTTSQPNHRQVHFGIDQVRLEDEWTDHGRVGDAIFVFALCVHDGRLYASTCEPGKDQRGGIYRWEGDDRWTLVGRPDACNSISSLASFGGSLYAASSKYRVAGSSLPESENANLGGKIYRLAASGQWEHAGTLPGVEAVASLVVFRGQLYASSLYKPGGLFRYEGATTWTDCGTPDGKRVEA